MKFKHILKTAIISLQRNRARSLLAMLEIIIGVSSVILVVSIGLGGQNLILHKIQELGSRILIIEPGREPKGFGNMSEIFMDSLKPRDLEVLKRNAQVYGLDQISPVIFQTTKIFAGNKSKIATILGTDNNITEILNFYPAKGVFFSEAEVKESANVAVVGANVKKKLFGETNALGHKIKIKGKTFRIIGVLNLKGQTMMFKFDDSVLIPYSTAQKYFSNLNYLNAIFVSVKNENLVNLAKKNITSLLRQLHNLKKTNENDFHIYSQADIVNKVKTITTILTALLASVAAISLIVGGVGIMNVMFISVTERIREIGLRKAIGATNRDILYQFLTESVLLSCLGGIAGIILGIISSLLIFTVLTHITNQNWQFIISAKGTLIGFIVSVVIGIIFGLYPAQKAAKKSPIEALRTE